MAFKAVTAQISAAGLSGPSWERVWQVASQPPGNSVWIHWDPVGWPPCECKAGAEMQKHAAARGEGTRSL